MKKLLTFLGMIVVALSINAQTITLQSGGKGIAKSNDQFSGFHATFSYDKIESMAITGTEKGTFSAITIAGAYADGDFGTPELPVFRKMIAVPVGATPKVVVRSKTTTEYSLGDYGINTIFPAQPDVRKDQDLNDVRFVYDEAAYANNEYTRAPIAEIGVLGTMRGVIIGMVTVRPVQYNPVANSMIVHNDIDIEVIFENGNYKGTQDLYTNTYSPYFNNPYNVVFNRGVFEDHPDLYTAPVRMLVIANRMFEETLQPWLEWKTKKGFYMDVNYTDDIGTTASAIKTFCHQKYNEGVSNGTAPTFIVIVGDTPQVPASQTGNSTQKATDLYYATVDGDYFPDMYYSRMSAQTTQQLENQIEKILYYEQYQFEDPSYLDNVLLIAGADGTWNPRVGQPQINYAANNYYNEAHGYVNTYKYLNSYSGCYANLNNVGFANYTAHCGETSWADPSFNISGVNALTNLNKYFVAMGNCCLAADFGYGECIGEAFMRAEKKGAVGYIGSSPSSYWGDDFHFAVGAYAGNIATVTTPTLTNTTDGCYDLAFRDADFNCLSSHVFGGNLAVTYAHTNPGYTVHTSNPWYYWEAYNVLGDGSLMPYNSQANENTVSHLPILPIGLNSYEVNAVAGSYVAISKDGVLHGAAVANAAGVATVTLTPPITSGGEVDIVVTRNQYKPYITQVPAAALEGPYLTYDSYDVVGEEALTYISENSEITVTIKNVGEDPTQGALTVSITCDDPLLTIDNGTAQYNEVIPAGETASLSFHVTVANNIPDNKVFPVKVNILGSESKTTWESNMALTAYAPKFSLEKVMINDIEGGNLEPGTVATITTVVVNKGHADAYGVIGDIETEDEYVIPACETPERGTRDLPVGESMNLTFAVITDPAMPFGHEADISLLLNAQYNLSFDAPFNLSCSDYCETGSTNCSSYDDKFTYVQFGDITNTSGSCSGNGYSNYTDMTATLTPGQQYIIKVKVGYKNHHVRGWIDLNGNKNFDDNEALINITCSLANVEYSQTITIPEDAVPGTYRFRLRTKDSTPVPEACNAYGFGQTHDYSVIIPEIYPRVQNAVAELNGRDITLTWDAPAKDAPTGYNVYRNGDCLTSTPITETTFTEENLSEGIYVYNVTAVFSEGKESISEMSNVICIFAPQLCEKPIDLAGIDEESTAIITWAEPENIDGSLLGYNIYRDGNQINEELLADLRYEDPGLENGTYEYKVTAAYEHCEESELTDGVKVIINVVKVCELENNYQIFPNPAAHSVTIQGKGLNRVEIYDLQGRKLAEYNNVKETLQINDLGKYDSGIYFIKMHSTSNQSFTKRLTVIH